MATIDDTVGKLARVYDSQTDTWIPLVGSPTPHVHNISNSPDVDITEPLVDNEILEYSTSASAFINTDSPTFTDLSVTNNISSDFLSISDTASINDIVVTGESRFSYQFNSQSASYTLSVEDHGRAIPTNSSSANTITVPLYNAEPQTFTVTNSGTGFYVVDGVNNPTFNLVRGTTYTFVINASGHPFWIQTVSGGYSSGNIYSDGTTNLGTDNGTITWTIPLNAPNTLYYACEFHSSMQGTINITDPLPSAAFPVGAVVNIIQVGTGQTTIAAESGVTLRSEGNKLKTKGQYALVGIVKVAPSEWVVFGNLVS